MRFFNLYADEGKRKKFAHGIETDVGAPCETVNCSDCGRQWNKAREFSNLTIVLTNDNYPDFMRLSGTEKVLSLKAADILKMENVTGYCLKEMTTASPKNTPIDFQKLLRSAGENIKKMPENPPKYFYWDIAGNAELHEQSGLEITNCSTCGYVDVVTPGYSYVKPDHPKILDRNTWDGKDLFRLKHVSRYCCSERFYEIYHKHQLTGLEFREIPSM
ncbi:hypothetical protein B5M42_021405 [Paenibacillus athensensis]|uniref:hypothetical protein n=1 Tax=Paenibacillus athensensis TaxID=1967502 RepID=UPI0010701323|nr:hypothetical protein [Paenibacillus athensensis]MCD1261362.1 hypothetical protein [Paenibacillus athensensis]